MSYKSASNNNFIEAKKGEAQIHREFKRATKKDYFMQKGHKNDIKVQRKHKTMYKLKGNLQTSRGNHYM